MLNISEVLTVSDLRVNQCNAWSSQYPFVYFFIFLVLRTIFTKHNLNKLQIDRQINTDIGVIIFALYNFIEGIVLYTLTIQCFHPISWLIFVVFNF